MQDFKALKAQEENKFKAEIKAFHQEQKLWNEQVTKIKNMY